MFEIKPPEQKRVCLGSGWTGRVIRSLWTDSFEQEIAVSVFLCPEVDIPHADCCTVSTQGERLHSHGRDWCSLSAVRIIGLLLLSGQQEETCIAVTTKPDHESYLVCTCVWPSPLFLKRSRVCMNGMWSGFDATESIAPTEDYKLFICLMAYWTKRQLKQEHKTFPCQPELSNDTSKKWPKM